MQEIIKGSTVPPRGTKREHGTTRSKAYQLMELDVGDSRKYFVAELAPRSKPNSSGLPLCRSTLFDRIIGVAGYIKERTGRTFTLRFIEGGVQVWRTS